MRTPSYRIANLFIAAVIICAAFVVFGPETTVAQSINRSVSYQGKLLTASEIPVADGDYAVKFSLYDAVSGGNRLWTSSGTTASPSAITVTVHSGLFTVQLGDTSSGQNPFAFDWNQSGLYLGVTIASDSEMTPRKRLTSVPYAFVAETLQGQYASSSVDTTGGNLFALHQNSSTAATGDRTTLYIATSGTSNLYDYLIKANAGTDVFTVSRQGNVTTTGNFAVAGNVIIGDTSTDSVIFNAGVGSNLLPLTTNANDLGSPSFSWRNVYASGTVYGGSGTAAAPGLALFNLGGSGGANGFYIPSGDTLGVAINGNGPYVTFTGSSNGTMFSGNITPGEDNTRDIGLANRAFKNIYASGTAYIGTDVLVGLGAAAQSVCLENGTNCPSIPNATSTWYGPIIFSNA
ncbi:MAG: hypothetical protein V1745_04050, partial [Patescibacteria group bacterium]